MRGDFFGVKQEGSFGPFKEDFQEAVDARWWSLSKLLIEMLQCLDRNDFTTIDMCCVYISTNIPTFKSAHHGIMVDIAAVLKWVP